MMTQNSGPTPQPMPTHETRVPSVEEFTEVGSNYGWKLIEPQPRRLT
jgi:hypothetical protein